MASGQVLLFYYCENDRSIMIYSLLNLKASFSVIANIVLIIYAKVDHVYFYLYDFLTNNSSRNASRLTDIISCFIP